MKVTSGAIRGISRELEQFVREVRGILNGGLRLADQGQVRSFGWRSTASPVLVAYAGTRPPLAVVVLRATEAQATQGIVMSGIPCVWEYSRAGLLVSDIGSTTPGTEYDVTVLIVEG